MVLRSSFHIVHYRLHNNYPIDDFIRLLQANERAKFQRLHIMLEQYGAAAGMPYVKKVHPKLWELRLRGRREIRFLFSQSGSTIFFLHGFVKKTNKILLHEIKVADERLKKISHMI